MVVRYHAVDALIGLDARAVVRTPNGLGTYARQLARALTDLDTDNSYVIIRRPDSGPPVAAGPRVREVTLPGDPSTPSFGRAISRLGLDLYHSLHHFLPVGLHGPRVVLTLHDLIWLEHRDLIRSGPLAPFTRAVSHLYARVAIRHAVRRADRIIAISEHSRARAVAYFGLDPSQIEVVHHGVAHDLFANPRDGREPRQPPYFFCLGNSRPYKNLSTAIRAFAVCVRARPGARLVVTGRGDSTAELRDLATQLGIIELVTFTGPVEHAELVGLLHGAVALVFPSLVEGFGLPVLEAMAAGCPVVASNCPTVTEIAENAALLCDPSSSDDFAAAMIRLLDDYALRARLRRGGIERAAGFTWARCAERTLGVYEELLGSAVVGLEAAR
jgi:glycosyltransferase involved in cell wall biosynthesis